MSLARWSARFERFLETVVVVLLLALALEVVVGVVFRFLGAPLAWYDEVASVLLAWLTYWGAALAALKRAHIGFSGVVRVLPPRARVVAVLFGKACVVAFFLVLGWQGWKVLGVLSGETLVTISVPVQLTQSIIPIGAVLFVAAELLGLPAQLRRAWGWEATGGSAPATETSH